MSEKKSDLQFYNPQPLYSYNALFNFILDVRGRGKTYSLAKRDPIKAFLKTGEQFIYLRRYKNELSSIDTFFTDIELEFPDHEFSVRGKVLYCDKKIMGYAVNLSTAGMKKSVAYPLVTRIIYDEFTLEKGFIRYLPNEVQMFLNFYETVARTRENVKVYFIGNAVSLTNPYFLEYKIIPKQTQRFTSVMSFVNENRQSEHLMLVELGQDDDGFRDFKKKSKFGQIIEGSNYASMAIENEFIDGHDSFIMKKTPKSIYLFSITYLNEVFGLWVDVENSYMFVSRHTSKTDKKRNFVLTTDDHRPNMVLIDNFKKLTHFHRLKRAFQMGYLFFENIQIRNVFYDILKMINL